MTPANSLNYPEGMDRELAERWFGTAENNGETFGFSETDEVSQRWLMLGRFPSLVWTNDFGSRTYFRFNDGTVIWRPSPELPYRVLESPPVGGSLYPADVDRDLATLWFGSASNDGQVFAFDENNPVCQQWLGLGRFPSLVWTNDFGGREYFRFSDGTVIWRSSSEAPFRMLSTAGAGNHSFSAIWGGGDIRFTQEYLNLTGPDLYAYGRQYCLADSGREHPGIDIGMSYNATLYAPADGTITCKGTGADGARCGAFNDTGDCCPVGGNTCPSVGVGRIEMALNENTMLIFGHSRECFHEVGAKVLAGQPIGTVGGMCGSHTHIEARVRDASCAAGWRVVDPREVLGQ
jgi:murein DD-endopeptidase MepM/ murein hydrolase activator NlpD